MQVVHTQAALASALSGLQGRVGFVPTMGNLHAGHLALVDAARQCSDRVVASIFVNPLQFGPGEDFASYPRTLDADCAALERAGVAVVYAPDGKDMYPDGPESVPGISVPYELAGDLEGRSRPGHFDGVATVVHRLFERVHPDVAVFGEKDYQQLLVIRWLVSEYDIPLELVGVPTVRDDDGLALSSRNQYLSPAERARAPVLYQVLQRCAAAVASGANDLVALAEECSAELGSAGFDPDYFAIRGADDLTAPRAGAPMVALAAARLGHTRLIDNLRIGPVKSVS
jgi:pantoate--beta-alanine ligase